MHSRFSLRQWLTLPYIALICGVSALIGTLSYRTGSEVVDMMARNLLLETVARIEQAVDRHLVGSAAVLETAFPQGMVTTAELAADEPALRQRFWAATALHMDSNALAFYGNEAGQMVAMMRYSRGQAEWRVRYAAEGARRTYDIAAIDAPLATPTFLATPLDPRQRPWYIQARTSPASVWTAVYIDHTTRDLVVTRAKRITDAAARLQGVVATDVPLYHLSEFVRSLPMTPHSVAFVMEANGQLIASTRTPNVQRDAAGNGLRVSARDGTDPLQLAAFQQVQEAMRGASPSPRPTSMHFDAPDGSAVQMAFSRLKDDAGLDWTVVVAVPRSDFMQGVRVNVTRTALIAAAAALAAAMLGLLILDWVSVDLRHLTRAARQVGEGQLDEVVQISGHGSLGELASTFREMQLRLRTDGLTGLTNRDWLMRCINHRIEQHRRQSDRQPFAVLFIDLNRFKLINDTLGHEGGDQVLVEISDRLRRATREGDVVARYAGDEFVVLLDQVPDMTAARQAHRHIRDALMAPLPSLVGTPLHGHSFGASVGLAMHPGRARNAEELVRLADQDMYVAKVRKEH
ncbi:MAG: hypothetical protein JWQ88_1675 [Rhodoferax sp.]|nr:hypothetical protein [Rhodoferax sp.]